MKPADRDVLEIARRFIIEGHARNTAAVAAVAYTPESSAPFTIAGSPGPALTLEELLAHLGEYPPCETSGMNPRGYMSEHFAYVVDNFQVAVPGEGSIDVRTTVVLVRHPDAWKVVHAHVSEGVAHLE